MFQDTSFVFLWHFKDVSLLKRHFSKKQNYEKNSDGRPSESISKN